MTHSPSHSAPAATETDKSTMRAALARAAPSRDELLQLIHTVRQPASDGRFNASAFSQIRRLRSDLGAGHAQVAGITTHSVLRANVLRLLSDVEALVAALEAIGRSTDPARAARLRTDARRLDARVMALEPEVSAALGHHLRRAGR